MCIESYWIFWCFTRLASSSLKKHHYREMGATPCEVGIDSSITGCLRTARAERVIKDELRKCIRGFSKYLGDLNVLERNAGQLGTTSSD